MSDYERYGDYDNLDENLFKKKTPVGIAFAILVGIFCVGVIGLLTFRVILFKSYPKSVRDLYFTETLTNYYESTDGKIEAKTQNIRAPYENAKNGYFFAGKLIFLPEAGELQVAVRYNVLNLDELSDSLGLEEQIEADTASPFTYRLTDNLGNTVSAPVYTNFESRAMYRYQKLVFDGVDLSGQVNWIRLEIFLEEKSADEPIAAICVYENNEDYAKISDYRLSGREKP